MMRRTRRNVIAFCLGLSLFVSLPLPARAQSKPIVTGAGSTWSQVAVDQWRADVQRFGLRINYQGVGSSAGRSLYLQPSVDFAVSEIPFEPSEQSQLQSQQKTYEYVPIVAGGTALMYNLRTSSGSPITTLRLSAATIAGIFTGGIKTWTDQRLRDENPGLALPDQPIIPVVRSDGSGTSAQFTSYMWKQEGGTWCPFAAQKGISPCRFTSSYPEFQGSVAQSGSDGVANYVHSESTGRGAITYVETAYALQRGRPVAFLKNASGAYTLPTSKNVSIALTKVTLNSDHTQNLDQVYTSGDPAAYAMSSYSYLIAPTNKFDTAKGDSLGQFMIYFACEGQRKADLLGYSPIPANLVQIVFDAVKKVPGAPAPPPMSGCNNPIVQGESGTSDSTAGALSGGTTTTGSAPPPGTAPGAATGSGGGASGGAAGSGASGGANGGGGTASGMEGSAAGVDGSGAAQALAAGALPQIELGSSMPSAVPMAAAAVVVGLLAFGPPMLGGMLFRGRRRPQP